MEIYTISGAPPFGATTCPPGWTPTPNGNCGGPGPRYYLKAAADLQTALRSLGARVGDPRLSVPIDGIVGPETVQAAERAFSTHIGPGQAPAALRAGGLGILGVAQNASVMADLANAETTRRGGAIAVTPPPPKGIKVAIGPAEIITEPPGASRKVWALVGLNALAASIGIYFAATRDS